MTYNIVKMVNYVLKNNAWSLHDVQLEDIGEVRVFCYDDDLNETTDLSKCFNIFLGYEINNHFYSFDVYFERVKIRIANVNSDYYDTRIELNFDDIDTEEKFFQYCLVNNTLGLTFDDISAILKVQRLIPEEVLNPLND
ncbi:Uncharacterised protein [Escherichia coli]|uniref:hypothetical protein n=1 Tax=Escherichia coli TaxID=562 RepID=UPI001A6347DF|nr:hypothetical protein [Escherichia coli]VVZ30477.1 Uncharacterised protein [Escherichia coli]VWN21038.1 Uncharacterised protein [Escherichia coli]